MSDPTRRTWSASDDSMLIGYWPVVGSIVLIAMLLGRSTSSVQTRASRLNLPRRQESKERHRRRWTDAEDGALSKAVREFTRPDGRIPIDEVADRVGRSIDAVVSKLLEDFWEESELVGRIILPTADEILKRQEENTPADAAEPAVTKSGRPHIPDTRKKGRERNCLSCQKPFYSKGAHNRICDRCKAADGSLDWGF